MLKYVCETDYLSFVRVMFRLRESRNFMVSAHHRVIAETLQKVTEGKIKRLVITIPPGYTKTELSVINWIAWCLALYPRARFIHSSYSDDLALLNSTTIRDIITSDYYQFLWPMKLRLDTQAKKRWYNEQSGGLMAVSSGGAIIGFRAGRMEPGFTGAIVLDDLLKPEDAYSDTLRNKVNNRINNTFRSRVAQENVPIILIMQRIHEDDPAAFLLKGGTGEDWHHIDIPALVTNREYPAEYTHGIEVKHDISEGPLWKYKHSQADLELMKATDPYTYSSQYDQRPSPMGGSMFKSDWWVFYDEYNHEKSILLPEGVTLIYKNIYADTAMKAKEYNDFSVLTCWGKGVDGKIYLLDLERGKWEAPELEKRFLNFCNKHEMGQNKNSMGVRFRKVEDKASGTGLIQAVNKEKGYEWVQGIPRDIDKVSRAFSCVPSIASGKVVLPEYAPWLADYLLEFEKFSPKMTHKHDDQIDPTMDAINDMLIDDQVPDYGRSL